LSFDPFPHIFNREVLGSDFLALDLGPVQRCRTTSLAAGDPPFRRLLEAPFAVVSFKPHFFNRRGTVKVTTSSRRVRAARNPPSPPRPNPRDKTSPPGGSRQGIFARRVLSIVPAPR